jgi:phospholipase C
MSQSEKQFTNVLDTFDHVVVLMLENRSFDNLLGYLY